ncbi:hypothetical protein THRCLA_03631 [Thraustotheca clavata]|uniref:PH domain-containing protein n=1 Tax=Thraustotheca clavata TaxID=74557 RepID=A0A1W0A1P3_9STRA|nr:hypothetical protein THRCLA_03631 [Thraustotheca clavata]
MNQTELQLVRKTFNARYATLRPWPLRIPKTVRVASPPPIPPRPEPSPVHVAALPVFESISFCLRDKINDGFGFLCDRIGNSIVVVCVDDNKMSLSLGSVMLSIDNKVVQIDGTKEIMMDEEKEDDSKSEAMQLQMINLLKAHGVASKTLSRCTIEFVATPALQMTVDKLNPSSKLKRWSRVVLRLQCGYLNWFVDENAASGTTVEMLHHSHVALAVLHCDIESFESERGYGFTLIEIEKRHEPDEGLDEIDDDAFIESDVKKEALELAKAAFEAAKSKYILPKRIINKTPRRATFRVCSIELRDEWIREIRAAQNFRAEDYLATGSGALGHQQ